MRDEVRSHYERLADTYDDNWAVDAGFLGWMGSEIVRLLRLSPEDRIADIGCGTGLFAKEVSRLVRPTHPIMCADPSESMVRQIGPDPRLTPVVASAEEIAAGRVRLQAPSLDAVWIKEAIHHVDDPASALRGLAELLTAGGGRLLVVLLPTRIGYPLFRAALDRFEELQPDPDVIAGHMRGAGLRVTTSQAEYLVDLDTERYVQMVRNRYMSLLSTFSDAEIEAGVAEIKARYRQPRLTFPDRFVFLLGVRDGAGAG